MKADTGNGFFAHLDDDLLTGAEGPAGVHPLLIDFDRTTRQGILGLCGILGEASTAEHAGDEQLRMLFQGEGDVRQVDRQFPLGQPVAGTLVGRGCGFGTVEDIGAQFFTQFKGVAFTVIYTAIVTYLILKVIDLVMGLRVSDEEETVGLDLALHNERGYNL